MAHSEGHLVKLDDANESGRKESDEDALLAKCVLGASGVAGAVALGLGGATAAAVFAPVVAVGAAAGAIAAKSLADGSVSQNKLKMRAEYNVQCMKTIQAMKEQDLKHGEKMAKLKNAMKEQVHKHEEKMTELKNAHRIRPLETANTDAILRQTLPSAVMLAGEAATAGWAATADEAATASDAATAGEVTTAVAGTFKKTEDERSLATTMTLSSDKLKIIAEMRNAANIELDELQRTCGKFSYYLWRGKLVTHLEDEEARRNRDLIDTGVKEIARRYLQVQESVSAEVSNESVNAELCSPRIGAKLFVNHVLQTAGMYVFHKRVVHWVSVAHNYVRSQSLALNHDAFTENPRRADSQENVISYVPRDFGDDPMLVTDDQLLRSSIFYSCLKHKPCDKMGRSLWHSVDIMIGQVQWDLRRNDAEAAENAMPLFEVRGSDGLIYKIQNVWRPTPSVGNELGGYARYDITLEPEYERKYKNVTARLPGNNLAEGTIEPSFATIYLDGEGYHNVLLISSRNGVSPRYGDSGSIWVARDSSEAVAITVGKMRVQGVACEVWVAILLYPCLEVLCLEHKQTLIDVSEIKLFDGHSVAEVLE